MPTTQIQKPEVYNSSKDAPSQNTNESKDEAEETQCGIGPCKPQSIQPCASLMSFTVTYSFLAILMNTVAVLLSSQITSLEKQFNFNSTVSGLLLSCHEIGYLAVLLFISHFGKHSHVPRLLGAMGLLFGFTSIITGLAYFIEPAHLPTNLELGVVNTTGNHESKYLCSASNSSVSSSVTSSQSSEAQGSSPALWVIGISMAVYGVSKSPRNSLAGLYIDNNVKAKSKTSMHIGSIFSAILFGPSLALLVGGAFAKLPVNLQDTYLTPTDPRWIGAWWLGFIVFGVAGIVLSLPLFCMPRRIPGAEPYDIPHTTPLDKIKDLPLSVIRVIRRPVYTLSVLNSVFRGFALGGLLSFGPKYLEYQFNTPAWKTSLILGISHTLTTAVGTFLGGIVTGRLNLSRQGCIKFIMITHVIGIGLNALAIVFGCDNTPIEGLDFFRNDSAKSYDCLCDRTPFLPVCGEDHVTYSSPCQAGCWNQTEDIYGSCSRLGGLSATPGICDNGCNSLYPYLVAIGLSGLASTFGIMPHIMVYIRSVEDRDKAMALGLYNFLSTLLGWMPAPIVYGKVIDSACKILRHSSSKGFGACSLYDIVDLRYKVYGMEVSLKLLAFIVLIISLVVCRWEDNKNEKGKGLSGIQIIEVNGTQKKGLNGTQKKGLNGTQNTVILTKISHTQNGVDIVKTEKLKYQQAGMRRV